MIHVNNLYKSFGKNNVLKGIDEHIKKGEVVVVIGPSGSGKSTFLRCLNLLEEPTSGNVIFEDNDITDKKKVDINKIREKMGMVFQQFNLFPHKTVLENLTIAPLKVKKISKEQAEKKALELLERVGLTNKAKAYPSSLSGGQKQRIAIARALAIDPEIIVFDDSFSALDFKTDSKLREELSKQTKGKTVIIVAQRISTILNADQIIVLDEGKIVGKGTHKELMQNCEEYKEIAMSQLTEEELA